VTALLEYLNLCTELVQFITVRYICNCLPIGFLYFNTMQRIPSLFSTKMVLQVQGWGGRAKSPSDPPMVGDVNMHNMHAKYNITMVTLCHYLQIFLLLNMI